MSTDKSFQVIQILRQQVGTNLAAHLTCVGRSRREINQRVREYAAAGIRRIVALRGDAPAGETFKPLTPVVMPTRLNLWPAFAR